MGAEQIALEGEENAHLVRVMRKREGHQILITDGEGTAYTATITSISRQRTLCRISARHDGFNEPAQHVRLAVGLTKNPGRFDYLVEKTTEIGVSSIVPLVSERTIRQAPRTERWRSIALAAMKQSLRSRLPQIEEPTTLARLLAEPGPSGGVILHEQSDAAHLASLCSRLGERPTIIVGPEGGFTEEELRQAVGAGWFQASLGARRLRTETAAVVAAALLLSGAPPR